MSEVDLKIDTGKIAHEVKVLIQSIEWRYGTDVLPAYMSLVMEPLYAGARHLAQTEEHFELAMKTAKVLAANTHPENPMHAKATSLESELSLAKAQAANSGDKRRTELDLTKLVSPTKYAQ